MDEGFREQGRRRAQEERAAIEWAVEEIRERSEAADVELEPAIDEAYGTLSGIPSRHRAAFEGMAEELSVDRDVYAAFVFSFSDIADEISESDVTATVEEPAAGIAGEGCTNVLATAGATATDGPLVLKNRDIVGRGIRPVAIVEQPAIGDYHGFITVDTCGTVLLYKGVNDAGLAAANTHIAVAREEVGPEEGVRNGIVVRRILEECETVGEARELVESYPERLFQGQTLILADEDDAAVLEVDPVAESVTDVSDSIVARTNHFHESDSPHPDSSEERLERARSLLDDIDGPVSHDDLASLSTDHENGPGEYSVCRHAGEKATHWEAFGQETTVSASVFEGGRVAVDAAIGYPCLDGFTRYEFGEEIPEAVLSGQRWLEFVS